mmetsp:Transcript_92202/g.192789  ORF Transcript_92202/g.192789 Transcript_92202/m.192789 type:complete len:279 (-) Transcript_92202:2006-2842(-)
MTQRSTWYDNSSTTCSNAELQVAQVLVLHPHRRHHLSRMDMQDPILVGLKVVRKEIRGKAKESRTVARATMKSGQLRNRLQMPSKCQLMGVWKMIVVSWSLTPPQGDTKFSRIASIVAKSWSRKKAGDLASFAGVLWRSEDAAFDAVTSEVMSSHQPRRLLMKRSIMPASREQKLRRIGCWTTIAMQKHERRFMMTRLIGTRKRTINGFHKLNVRMQCAKPRMRNDAGTRRSERFMQRSTSSGEQSSLQMQKWPRRKQKRTKKTSGVGTIKLSSKIAC